VEFGYGWNFGKKGDKLQPFNPKISNKGNYSMTEEKSTFHTQAAVLRVSMWANIFSWAVLVLYLLNFTGDLVNLFQNWPPQLPADVLSQVSAWTSLLSKPIFGGMYFLVLQGVSQLLNLGLDVYLQATEEVEVELEEK